MKKQLKDLNLLDRFLFAEATEDPVIMQYILEIILGKDIELQPLYTTEKEERVTQTQRVVKLDVCAWDTEDTVYSTEVQKQNTYNLPKRSRLYHGIIDSKQLPSGEVNYNLLNDSYFIMIMPFDLFKRGRYRYTFEMSCREESGLVLGDGATRVFLNTKGTDRENESQELIDLLRYFETTTSEVSNYSGSIKIQEMHKRIERIKASEEIGVRFMQAWEERIYDKMEAREEGLAEGRAEGLAEGRAEGRAEGLVDGFKQSILKLFAKGQSEEMIADVFEMPIEDVRKIVASK